MSIYESIPYTYRIKWSNTGMSYYGVQYSITSNPINFWKTYFTSSKYVKDYISTHGQPDVIEIRKTFTGEHRVTLARNWEHRVLKRLKVITRSDYLNRGAGKGIPPMFGDKNPMNIPSVRAKHAAKVGSKEHKDKLKKTLNLPEQRKRNSTAQKIAQNKPEVKEAKSKRTSKYFQDPLIKQKHKNACNTEKFKKAASNKLINTVWMNNGLQQKYISRDRVDEMIALGWDYGMLDQTHNFGKRVMNNGSICKMIHPNDVDNLLSAGWVFGMLIKSN